MISIEQQKVRLDHVYGSLAQSLVSTDLKGYSTPWAWFSVIEKHKTVLLQHLQRRADGLHGAHRPGSGAALDAAVCRAIQYVARGIPHADGLCCDAWNLD